ncbi:MAG: response regulator, partial [Candidatus Scalindua sp.]|nr:response regulator [Candidatus Scalindua sp.]
MNSIPLKILIVDDNEDHQILMEEQLVENSHNIDMVFVESGNECMLRLSKESYDAVIVDFNLPDMDGLGVLKEMNRKGYDYPVLMVTAFGDENIAVETMKLGAQDYIVKSEGFAEKLPEILYKVAHEYKLRKNNELTERKLKISESKYKALIDNMIDVVFTADNQ